MPLGPAAFLCILLLKREMDFAPEGSSARKEGLTAVGCGNLGHQPQAGAVGCAAVRFQRMGRMRGKRTIPGAACWRRGSS